jgi:prepilin-type N-terminal cleavage/methylation domain-containing protein
VDEGNSILDSQDQLPSLFSGSDRLVKTPRFSVLRSSRAAFTLIEIMITVSILGILLAIAMPTWVRQRELSRLRACQENLSKIDGAKEQWAMDNMKSGASGAVWADLVAADGSGYLNAQPVCPAEGDYTIGEVDSRASCSVVDPFDHNNPSAPWF